MLIDQYNNSNSVIKDPNHSLATKQRRYTLNVEYLKNEKFQNHKLSVKASSLDDLKNKIAREIDFPNDTKINLAYKKGNKLVSMNDLLDLVSMATCNVRIQLENPLN